MGFPGGFIGKESAWQRRRCKRHGFHPSGWEVPLEKEMEPHSSILAWENSRGGGAWWATVLGVAKSQTQPSD